MTMLAFKGSAGRMLPKAFPTNGKCIFRQSNSSLHFKALWNGSQNSFSSAANSEDFDLVVIGGGPGGYVAAIRAAQLGLKTSCIEKRGTLGGTCLNVGCIPSKALLNISHKYKEATSSVFEKMGIQASGVKIDVTQMQKHKSQTVQGLTQGIEFLFRKNKVSYFKGSGKLKDAHTIAVSPMDGGPEKLIGAKHIILATGSESTPFPGGVLEVDEKVIVSSTGALDLKQVPKRLAVIGAGVIGLELGSVWRALGAQVTVIEYLNRAIPAVDEDIATTFTKIMEKSGMKFLFSQKVVGADVSDTGATLHLESANGGSTSTVEADVVLVAIGRRPYSEGLGLEQLGINLDSHKRVPTDKLCRVPQYEHIRAIGDLIDGPMLAHKAEEEGIACVEHIAGVGDGSINHANIPSVIYTHPEVAGIGLTEQQVREKGIEYNKGTFPFAANSRARAMGDSEGFVKVIADKATDKILGAWIIGPNAGELISELVLAMEYGAASEDLGRTCHAHPTLSEAIKEACMACYGKAIHIA